MGMIDNKPLCPRLPINQNYIFNGLDNKLMGMTADKLHWLRVLYGL